MFRDTDQDAWLSIMHKKKNGDDGDPEDLHQQSFRSRAPSDIIEGQSWYDASMRGSRGKEYQPGENNSDDEKDMGYGDNNSQAGPYKMAHGKNE